MFDFEEEDAYEQQRLEDETSFEEMWADFEAGFQEVEDAHWAALEEEEFEDDEDMYDFDDDFDDDLDVPF